MKRPLFRACHSLEPPFYKSVHFPLFAQYTLSSWGEQIRARSVQCTQNEYKKSSWGFVFNIKSFLEKKECFVNAKQEFHQVQVAEGEINAVAVKQEMSCPFPFFHFVHPSRSLSLCIASSLIFPPPEPRTSSPSLIRCSTCSLLCSATLTSCLVPSLPGQPPVCWG